MQFSVPGKKEMISSPPRIFLHIGFLSARIAVVWKLVSHFKLTNGHRKTSPVSAVALLSCFHLAGCGKHKVRSLALCMHVLVSWPRSVCRFRRLARSPLRRRSRQRDQRRMKFASPPLPAWLGRRVGRVASFSQRASHLLGPLRDVLPPSGSEHAVPDLTTQGGPL